MRFTLRQLEYFVATCDAESVTEAALNIPVAQSSVSAAISQLESALGVPLLIRHHARGVSPTPAGRQLLVRARALLREAEQLERLAAELTDDLSGRLELGCLVTIAPLLLPRLCQSFQVQHPEVTFLTVEAGQDTLLEGLRSGRLALALTYDLDIPADVEFEPLASLPPYALFPADHPLAERDEVSLAELADLPLVLLDLPLSRDYFCDLFLAAGLQPTIVKRSPHPEMVRTLVANGLGYTILNSRLLNRRALDGQPLTGVPITPPARPMTIGVASLRIVPGTRLSEAFAAHCRAAVASAQVPALLAISDEPEPDHSLL